MATFDYSGIPALVTVTNTSDIAVDIPVIDDSFPDGDLSFIFKSIAPSEVLKVLVEDSAHLIILQRACEIAGIQFESEQPTPPEPPTPTQVTFTRYGTPNPSSPMFTTLGTAMYIPSSEDMSAYFSGMSKSALVDPQPSDVQGVSINPSEGKVYQGTELATNIYAIKTDKIVIVWNNAHGKNPIVFTYNGIEFSSNDTDPINLETIGITGRDSGGSWSASPVSIIVDNSSHQMYIGNIVSAPTT